MAVTGTADGPPMRAGPPLADLVAGLYGALGICAALVRRGRTGAGETVGASLNNGLISLLAFLAANYLATGEEPARTGNDHAIVSPYGMFRTRDGEVALAPSQEQSYQRLVDALGARRIARRSALPDQRSAGRQPRRDQRRGRGAARDRHDRELDRHGSTPPACRAGGSWASPEVFADPQVHGPGDGAEPGASRPRHGEHARLPDQIRRGAVPLRRPPRKSAPTPTRYCASSAIPPRRSPPSAKPAWFRPCTHKSACWVRRA